MTEPEQKRKIIGEEFIRVFEEEAKKIGAVDFLAQGTIYPDVVESGLGGESAVIKSHHNVGGLPDYVDFKEIIDADVLGKTTTNININGGGQEDGQRNMEQEISNAEIVEAVLDKRN